MVTPADPLSIAGLPVSKAIVSVNPRLLAKGPSKGFNGVAIVPVRSVAWLNPVLPSFFPTILYPPETIIPLTSGPVPVATLLAMIVFFIVTEFVPVLLIPPPAPWEVLLAIVLLVMVSEVPLKDIAPPSPLEEEVFPVNVLLISVPVPFI